MFGNKKPSDNTIDMIKQIKRSAGGDSKELRRQAQRCADAAYKAGRPAADVRAFKDLAS